MKQPLIFLFLLSIIASSCQAPRSAVNKLYLIQLPESADSIRPLSQEPIESLCQLNEVYIHPAYAGRQIAIKEESHQIQYFNHHLWAVTPSDLFFNAMIEYYAQKRLFTQVSGRYWKTAPDYTITTHIYTLEVENLKGSFTVHLKMQLLLRKSSNKQIVVIHDTDREEVLKTKSLNAMAATLGSMLYEELETFSLKINNQLSKKADPIQ